MIYQGLNSSPIDELGNWCHKTLMGASGKYEAEQEGFHGNPVSANQPCQWPLTSTVSRKDFQNTVFTMARLPTRVGRVGQ